MSQQRELLEPFPDRVVKTLPGRGGKADYVSWTDKIQRILQVAGDFDWQVIQITESGDTTEPVAVHGRLVMNVDGTEQSRDGVGIGTDAKKAETDAFARACSKFGVGLHLWCQGGDKDGGYWITGVLDKEQK